MLLRSWLGTVYKKVDNWAFGKKHSTSLALVRRINKITSAIDQYRITAGVFLDLLKAFDTINRRILIDKLGHYGIRGVALNWMISYLSRRK